MPPANEARRLRLADAAVELLAREGARGLTHRGVDALADEPAGTTSRYFRTREALVRAAAERLAGRHFADLAAAPPVTGALPDHLAGMVFVAVTRNQAYHLAVFEVFLEATRRPELAVIVNDIRTSQVELFRKMHAAAGIDLSAADAARLIATLNGLMLMAMSSPGILGLSTMDGIRDIVREAVRSFHRELG